MVAYGALFFGKPMMNGGSVTANTSFLSLLVAVGHYDFLSV